MTERIHMFQGAHIAAADHGDAIVVISQDCVPGRILHLRVYELVPDMNEPHMMVLRDALLADQTRHADAIIAEYGVAGYWSPSSITVTLIDLAGNRIIVDNAIAHAIWNLELGAFVRPSGAFQVVFQNDMVVPRTVRAAMTVREEVNLPGDRIRIVEESNRSLLYQVQQLQSAMRALAAERRQTKKDRP